MIYKTILDFLTMAKVYDVPADVLIGKLAEILKNEDIPSTSLGFHLLKLVHMLINLLKTEIGGILDVLQF